MLKSEGLQCTIIMENSDVEENHVIKTEPERNAEVEYNSAVKVYVSLGPEEYNVIMPDVVGMELMDAVTLLENTGFNVKSEKQDSELPQNEVIAQSISALDESGQPRIVDPRQDILITYSTGQIPTTSLNITFPVPEGLSGTAQFKAYVNGNLSGTADVDNIGYVSTIQIPIKGNEMQKVVVEAIGRDGESHKIGVFNVDFATHSVETVEFDIDMLSMLYPGENIDEPGDFPDNFEDEADDEIDEPVPEMNDNDFPTVPDDNFTFEDIF